MLLLGSHANRDVNLDGEKSLCCGQIIQEQNYVPLEITEKEGDVSQRTRTEASMEMPDAIHFQYNACQLTDD